MGQRKWIRVKLGHRGFATMRLECKYMRIGSGTGIFRSDTRAILKWARENGCSWDQQTCKEAYYNDNLETLK
jgi:hypothetical protein